MHGKIRYIMYITYIKFYTVNFEEKGPFRGRRHRQEDSTKTGL
jgi:hypothetical protein